MQSNVTRQTQTAGLKRISRDSLDDGTDTSCRAKGKVRSGKLPSHKVISSRLKLLKLLLDVGDAVTVGESRLLVLCVH